MIIMDNELNLEVFKNFSDHSVTTSGSENVNIDKDDDSEIFNFDSDDDESIISGLVGFCHDEN